MKRTVLPGALALCLAQVLALPAAAQDDPAAGAVQAPGAVVRWLDKISGQTGDLELSRGQAAQTGRLTVLLDDCRFPGEGVPTDAYAHLTIRDALRDGVVFSGWMLAESPALNAMDHNRYDVWVLRCLTAEGEGQ
jgi:hypothetical protein